MKQIRFTKEGHDTLQKEQQDLRTERKTAVEDLRKAREMVDLSENGYYKAARFKLNDIDRRIRMVTHLLKTATVPHIVVNDTVGIGCTVTIDDGKQEKKYLMVGCYESDPSLGKLSIVSPIGKSLQGKRKGERFNIESPSGKKEFTITSLHYAKIM